MYVTPLCGGCSASLMCLSPAVSQHFVDLPGKFLLMFCLFCLEIVWQPLCGSMILKCSLQLFVKHLTVVVSASDTLLCFTSHYTAEERAPCFVVSAVFSIANEAPLIW